MASIVGKAVQFAAGLRILVHIRIFKISGSASGSYLQREIRSRSATLVAGHF
jgi:hypothetical protein